MRTGSTGVVSDFESILLSGSSGPGSSFPVAVLSKDEVHVSLDD